jgi:hypothetical protein
LIVVNFISALVAWAAWPGRKETAYAMGDIAVDDADLSLATDEIAIETHLRALYEHDLDGAHRVYRKDAVLKFPQQGVTIVGRNNIRETRRKKTGSPAVPTPTVVHVRKRRGRDDNGAGKIERLTFK